MCLGRVNPESRLRQESLIPVAAALRGDADLSNIILYDERSGVSGTQEYDERPELSRLYLDIANGISEASLWLEPTDSFVISTPAT